MKKLGKAFTVLTCISAILAGSGPAFACATPQDVQALQAATVQQRLMVAALTCHDVDSYNRFVITYRRELQDSDAALMAFFQKSASGTPAYHAYKTRLANTAALNSVRNDNFCRDAEITFRSVLRGRATLADALATLPQSDTGFDACYKREAREDKSAPVEKDWRW